MNDQVACVDIDDDKLLKQRQKVFRDVWPFCPTVDDVTTIGQTDNNFRFDRRDLMLTSFSNVFD